MPIPEDEFQFVPVKKTGEAVTLFSVASSEEKPASREEEKVRPLPAAKPPAPAKMSMPAPVPRPVAGQKPIPKSDLPKKVLDDAKQPMSQLKREMPDRKPVALPPKPEAQIPKRQPKDETAPAIRVSPSVARDEGKSPLAAPRQPLPPRQAPAPPLPSRPSSFKEAPVRPTPPPQLSSLRGPAASASAVHRPEAPPQPKSREEAITFLTNEVVREAALRMPERYLEERLRGVIAARLRDVRDSLETEEVLARSVADGGLGLSAIDIQKIRSALEPRLEKIGEMLYKKQKGQILEALQSERSGNDARANERLVKDRAELDHLYSQVTGKQPTANSEQSTGLERKALSTSQDSRSKAQERPQVQKTDSRPTFVKASAGKLPTSPAKREESYQPQPQPTMTDVRPPSPLVGPVEELRRLTLADFRKLAANPKESAGKLRDKVKLLEGESLVKHLDAVKALRESEVFKAYFAILSSSFAKGASIEETLSAPGGLPTLTKDEFDAIMDLNQTLRL